MEQGLPHNSVHAISQTRDGYLWIGTQNGLARFDGARFVNFNPTNTPLMQTGFVYCLREGHDGSLWIGLFNGGLLNMKNGRFSRWNETDGLSSDAVRALCETSDGALWIGTTNGLTRLKSGKLTRFNETDGLLHPVVRSICEDTAGSLWVATSAGLNLFQNEQLVPAPLNNDSEIGSPRVLLLDDENVLWIGGKGGLARLKQSRLSTYSRNEGLSDEMLNALHRDRYGQLWIGSYGGLGRLIAERCHVQKTSDDSVFDAVYAITEDREHNLWIGTKEGLVRLTRRPFSAINERQGLSHNNVMSVRQDGEGAWWIGTWGGGLNRIRDGVTKTFTTRHGLPLNQVLALCPDEQGGFWVGTDFNGGLHHFENEVFTPVRLGGDPIDPVIRVLHQDRQRRLWIGTGTSLACLENGIVRRYTMDDGLAGNAIRVLCEDRTGRLWIGTSGGLTFFENEKFTSLTAEGLTNIIIALHEDAAGDLWIGTVGGGLCRIKKGVGDAITSPASRFTTQSGLYSDDVLEILEDDQGRLWMSSRSGIYRARRQDFDDFDAGKLKNIRCVAYGKRDGLPSLECNAVAKPCAWKGNDGRLWFATAKGLAVVNPAAEMEPVSSPPMVVIEEVMADKRPLKTGIRNQESESNNFHLIIPPGRGDLEFHYTALSLTAPEKNRFKYKLESFDPDWVVAGERRVAYYNNLPPGEYCFRVLACNHDGVWNSLDTNVKVSLRPHFWQTWWFLCIGVIVPSIVIGGTARYITKRKLQRKLERLEQQHALERERSRIAQDMHDDLGARLTEIMFLSGAAQDSHDSGSETKGHVVRIEGAARELVQNLDAIVWAVDPQNDTLNDLALYLHDYADRFLGNIGLHGRFQIQRDLPPRPVSSALRHSLLLVVKEALNNIAKHASCTEVQFKLSLENDRLSIVISDDGQGYSPAMISDFGNGLQNMRERIGNAGGYFEMNSELGKGTRIRLEVPLQQDNGWEN